MLKREKVILLSGVVTHYEICGNPSNRLHICNILYILMRPDLSFR